MSSIEQGPQHIRNHAEPEKPLVYEPPDLHGRKHVEKVTGEFRVREDGCLADKLQSEEFEFHFGKNKSERYLGKMDIKTAKDIYISEVEASGLLSKEELKNLCNQDAALAQDIDNQIKDNVDLESQRKQAVEMQDEEFARYLEAKERQKHEEERRARLARRIAQDRATAERLQRQIEAEASVEEDVAKGVHNIKIQSSPQKGGWAIDCEVGTSPGGERTQQELLELKDQEIARKLQLKEAKLEKKRVEEETDRKIAMRLQEQEAQDYRKKKEMRRAQSERRPGYDEELVANERRKRLQSVDATGKHIHNGDQHLEHRQRSRAETSPSRYDSERGVQRPSAREEGYHTPEHGRREGKVEEPIYLKAVDSPSSAHRSHNGESRTRANQTVDERKVVQKQQDLYNEAANRSRNEQVRNDDVKRSNSDRSNLSSNRLDNRDHERRLVDDQRALKQQAHNVEKINQQKKPKQSSQRRSVKSKNSSDETSWDLQVGTGMENVRGTPSGRHQSDSVYDTPEENNKIQYNNVARSIDPTYQTIGPPKPHTSQIGILDSDSNSVAEIRPVPVIQNVKRSSMQEQKKKKKFFSKKEKSPS